MKLKFYLILIFIFSSCTSETNSSQNPDCECTLEPPKDERIFTSTDSSKRKFGVDINIENYVKANFQNGGKTETLVEKILANNPEITQKAYLFWTITLERCKDVCRNNALSNEEKMDEKSKILTEYRSEIAKIIKEDEENSQSTDSEIVEEENKEIPEPEPEPIQCQLIPNPYYLKKPHLKGSGFTHSVDSEPIPFGKNYRREEIVINKMSFVNSFSMHPSSTTQNAYATFDIPKGAKYFRATFGFAFEKVIRDNEAKIADYNDRSSWGIVKIDGTEADRKKVKGVFNHASFEIEIPKGSSQLILEVDADGSTNANHTAWGNARFECK